MSSNAESLRNQIRLAGWGGVLALLFFPAVALQMSSNWFPEQALQEGTMAAWLEALQANIGLALPGIAFSVVAIIGFMIFALGVVKMLPANNWKVGLSSSLYQLGVGLAFVSFVFAFGFSWGLYDLMVAPDADVTSLTGIATMGIQGFLTGDDLATTLIASANGLVAAVALRHSVLPKWLCWWGIIAGIFVVLVLFRYFIPELAIFTIAYPMVILWFGMTGIHLLVKTSKVVASSSSLALAV